MGVMLAVAVLFMFAIVIEKTDGACCYSMGHGYCADCTRSTPRCGYYSCNIFGCNCGGGCRRAPSGHSCYTTFDGGCRCTNWRKRRSTETTDAAFVFNGYDLNKNDQIEKVEFSVAFNQTGLTEEELFVQWSEMDENKDDVITIEELDHDKI